MKEYIQKSIAAKQTILEDEKMLQAIDSVCKIVEKAIREGKKVLLAGNGGSASDCNHLSTEFVSKFRIERNPHNSVSLTANNSLITAIANDYSFDNIFSRQVEALGEKGDVFFAFSTSGESKNIVKALDTAKTCGLVSVGFTGQKHCTMDGLCDVILKVPSDETSIIQESHIMLGHLICKIVEENLSRDDV